MPPRTADASQPCLCVCVCYSGLGLLNSFYILLFTSSFPNIWSRWLHCSMIMTCLWNHYLEIAVTLSLLQSFYVAGMFEKGCMFDNWKWMFHFSNNRKKWRQLHLKCNGSWCYPVFLNIKSVYVIFFLYCWTGPDENHHASAAFLISPNLTWHCSDVRLSSSSLFKPYFWLMQWFWTSKSATCSLILSAHYRDNEGAMALDLKAVSD